MNTKLTPFNQRAVEHQPASSKFDVTSTDSVGREFSGFCPRCLMTEVEAAKDGNCTAPKWLVEELKEQREEIIEMFEELIWYHNDEGVTELESGVDYIKASDLNDIISKLKE